MSIETETLDYLRSLLFKYQNAQMQCISKIKRKNLKCSSWLRNKAIYHNQIEFLKTIYNITDDNDQEEKKLGDLDISGLVDDLVNITIAHRKYSAGMKTYDTIPGEKINFALFQEITRIHVLLIQLSKTKSNTQTTELIEFIGELILLLNALTNDEKRGNVIFQWFFRKSNNKNVIQRIRDARAYLEKF